MRLWAVGLLLLTAIGRANEPSFFDGAAGTAAPGDTVVGAPTRPAGAAARGPTLSERMIALFVGTTRDRADFARITRAMLGSAAAQGEAENFVARGVPVRVRFARFEPGVLGEAAIVDLAFPAVALEQSLRAAPPERAAETLAHELFGHAVPLQRAREAGVEETYHLWDGNETYAYLLGWTVDMELGAPADPRLALMLDDPASYLNERHEGNLGYAVAMSRGELSEPAAVYRTRADKMRVAATKERRSALPSIDATIAAFRHLIAAHGESWLRPQLEMVEAFSKALRSSCVKREGLAGRLEGFAGFYAEHPQGRAEAEKVVRGASSPLLAEMDERIVALKQRAAELAVQAPKPVTGKAGGAAAPEFDAERWQRVSRADFDRHAAFWEQWRAHREKAEPR